MNTNVLIYAALTVLLVSCSEKCPDPIQITQPDHTNSLSVSVQRLSRLSDSLNKNISRGYHFMASGQKDSALWYAGKAAAYMEMEKGIEN